LALNRLTEAEGQTNEVDANAIGPVRVSRRGRQSA
jgi:hypothetical protein